MTGQRGSAIMSFVGGPPSLPEELLRELPVAYATVLRLRASGVDDRVVAQVVNVSPDAIDLLVEVAERKLRRAAARRAAVSNG